MTILAAASGNDVAPGTLGFLVVFGMAVVLFFVFRSMSKHLRKVNAAARRNEEADSPGAEDDRGDTAPTSPGSSTWGSTGSGDRRRDS